MFRFLECAAIHAPVLSFPIAARRKLAMSAQGDILSQQQLAQTLDDMRYYFKTSQSVGKIKGGVKINAIPETASTLVNLRLAVEASVAEVEAHFESLVNPIAQKHGMAFEGFRSSCSSSEKRKICLTGVDAFASPRFSY